MVDPGDMPEPLSDGPKNAIFDPPSEGTIVAVVGGERPAVRLQKGIGEPAARAAEIAGGMAARPPVAVGRAIAVAGVGREGAVEKWKRRRRRKRVMVRVVGRGGEGVGRGGEGVGREEMGRSRRRRRGDVVVLVELRAVMVMVVVVEVGMVEGGKREFVREEAWGGVEFRVEGEGMRRRIHYCRRPESETRGPNNVDG